MLLRLVVNPHRIDLEDGIDEPGRVLHHLRARLAISSLSPNVRRAGPAAKVGGESGNGQQVASESIAEMDGADSLATQLNVEGKRLRSEVLGDIAGRC